MRIPLSLLLVLLTVLTACAAPTPTLTSVPTMTSMPPKPTTTPNPPFRVIGYVTEDTTVETVPYAKLTHINYSFLLPKDDGTLQHLANGWKLKKLVGLAHKENVQVLISVGGWGLDPQFESFASDPAMRAVFIKQSLDFMNEYNLDGIDIDWEYPDPGQSAQNYVALMRELRAALPAGALLTTAVPAFGENADNILAESFESLDFVNLMVYDISDQQHSSMQDTIKSLDYWLDRGLPAEKTVLGLPFYSRPSWVPYRKLVAQNPAAAQNDEQEYAGKLEYYNGIPTIQEKTKLALRRVSGVMFWAFSQDTLDETSLLSAIDAVIHSSR